MKIDHLFTYEPGQITNYDIAHIIGSELTQFRLYTLLNIGLTKPARGDESILGFLFTNQLQFQPTNNPGEQTKQ